MLRNTCLALLLAAAVLTAGCGENKASDQKAGGLLLIQTRLGDMKVRLYDETPQHRDNFLKLVDEGFYEDLLFHRVINSFMIQGGDPESRNAPADKMLGAGELSYTLPAENIGAIHKKGALAAARLPDQYNPERRSSACQFYIVQGVPVDTTLLAFMQMQRGMQYTEEQKELYRTTGGRPDLDGQYTVFGEVVEGLDVIDKLAGQATNQQDRPLEDIKMKIKRIQ